MLAPCVQAHKTRIAYKEAQDVARQNIYEHMYASHHCHICAVKGCAYAVAEGSMQAAVERWDASLCGL